MHYTNIQVNAVLAGDLRRADRLSSPEQAPRSIGVIGKNPQIARIGKLIRKGSMEVHAQPQIQQAQEAEIQDIDPSSN